MRDTFLSIAAHELRTPITSLRGFAQTLLKQIAHGVQSIKKKGGRILVQDEETAEMFAMPLSTIKTCAIDFILPLDKIAPALITLVMSHGAADFFRVQKAPLADT